MIKKKMELIPAILEKRFLEIKKKIKLCEDIVGLVQVDIFDGRLTPEKTFASAGYETSFKRLNEISTKITLELDLIVDLEHGPRGRGDKFLNSVNKIEPKRVVFHFSGVKDWDKIFKKINKKIEIGLGVWLTDDVKKVNKILKKYRFNYIQIMGIEKVGFGGQKLSDKVYGKIKYFHKKFPQLPIQIDGGVKIYNSDRLKKAGVTRLVSGSGFFEAEDLKERLKEFEKS